MSLDTAREFGSQLNRFPVVDAPGHLFAPPCRLGLLTQPRELRFGLLELSLDAGDRSLLVGDLVLHAGEELVDRLRHLLPAQLFVEILERLAECGTEILEHTPVPPFLS